MKTRNPFRLTILLTFLLGISLNLQAQDGPELREGYLTPPDHIAEEVLAPRHQNITLYNLNPDGEFFLNTQSIGLTPLKDMAKRYYNLGGLQINPDANRSRWMSTGSTIGLELIGARDGEADAIETPEDAYISHSSWSPDGSKLAYFAHFDDETHIYVADLESGESEQVTERPVLATLNSNFDWSADGQYLFTVLVPENRGMEPSEPEVPSSPYVVATTEDENRLRTYPDLLESTLEKKLVEYHTTGQLTRIDLGSGEHLNIGSPAMIEGIDADPAGEYLIVETMQKPFNYVVPVSSFGSVEEIWDLDGNVMAELEKSKANTGIPDYEETEDYDRRSVEWRPDGEGLSLLLASDAGEEEDADDNGDGDGDDDSEESGEEEEEDDATDRVMQWLPPFGENDMQIVYESENDIQSVEYSPDMEILFLTERRRGNEHLYAVFLDNPEETYTIFENDGDDFYGDPGNLMDTESDTGIDVVRVSPDGEYVYLEGTQYHEDYEENAPRPFVDRVNIRSGEKERIFQSGEDVYERVLAVLDDELNELVLERESPDMVPNSWLYNRADDRRTQLTDNRDYNEAVTSARTDRFKVTRSDGFEFWVEVSLPADWDGEPLPGLIWHYPSEYDDQEDYNEGLRRTNINSYPGVGTRSMEILTKHGYAVIDADWPISAERGEPNDGFLWSIVQNSTAVIDAVAERGYADRSRMAIGGHSYGAFGTAHAMIQTSFFKAGIAGDGNYNRTLTPMGFQRERSDLWRGQHRYLNMTPIFQADKLDGALLMYHGIEDQNVGTWPIHSKRMFHALNGMGKTAGLYMYPHEGHGPRAEETLLDLWARWVGWLDYYVKGDARSDQLTESE